MLSLALALCGVGIRKDPEPRKFIELDFNVRIKMTEAHLTIHVASSYVYVHLNYQLSSRSIIP